MGGENATCWAQIDSLVAARRQVLTSVREAV